MLGCQGLHDPCTQVLYRSIVGLSTAPHWKNKASEPLVVILGDDRGVNKALRGHAESGTVPAVEIVPKSLENKVFKMVKGHT